MRRAARSPSLSAGLAASWSKAPIRTPASSRRVEVEVDGIASLAEALDAIVSDGHAAVIRGEPSRFYPRNGSPVFRLLRPQEGLVAARTGARISNYAIRKHNLEPDHDNRWAVTWLPMFEDCPRAWVIFDVDRIPVPEHMAGDWVDDPDSSVEHVLSLLPEPFQIGNLLVVAVVVRSGAVQDRPGGVRHVQAQAGVLARPRADGGRGQAVDGRRESARRSSRLQRNPADLFRPAEARPWTARPRASSIRHLAGRGRYRRGPGAPARAGARDTTRAAAAAFGPAEGLDELCDALRARLDGELHVREHLLQAARGYVRQHGPNIDQAALVAALEGVALEYRTAGEVAGYGVDRLVDHVVRQERAATWMPFGRPPRPARLKPYFGLEGANRFAVLNDQRRFLRSWISRQHVYALARREIAERRAAAFAAEGLA